MGNTAKRRNDLPVDRPGKTVREYMQEIANASMVQAATEGFAVIDDQAARIATKLQSYGISNAHGFMASLADKVKQKSADLITGRNGGKA